MIGAKKRNFARIASNSTIKLTTKNYEVDGHK